MVWGGFVGNRIVGNTGVHLNTRFYHQSTADGNIPNYTNGWTIFLLVNRQVVSSIGNFNISASSLEADFVAAHQEVDCSSTVFQFQSTDFHGHDSFTNKRTHNKVNKGSVSKNTDTQKRRIPYTDRENKLLTNVAGEGIAYPWRIGVYRSYTDNRISREPDTATRYTVFFAGPQVQQNLVERPLQFLIRNILHQFSHEICYLQFEKICK